MRKRCISDTAFIIAPEVQDALRTGRPVVALESALITHGLPFPTNHETATSLEAIVRSTGCVPATIGLLRGKVHVGLAAMELQQLSDMGYNGPMVKVSRRDLGACIALKRSGGTTIAGTMVIAHAAGIRVFGTGGLGGVHRGGESSLDVSADLTELGRTPVAVVSSGVKAILDIGRTLEYLETQGVPVVTYGLTDDFPAFYSRLSGHKSPWRVESALQAAGIIHANQLLGLQCGTLFAVPIPDVHEAKAAQIQEAVEIAIRESTQNGMSKRGNDATPWLLRRVAELTKGEAVQSNIALLESNVRVAGEIAAAFAEHFDNPYVARNNAASTRDVASAFVSSTPKLRESKLPSPSVVIVGSAAVDITARLPKGTDLYSKSTLPGTVITTSGGVARNVAEATHRLLQGQGATSNEETLLISPIGQDALATVIIEGLHNTGQRVDGLLQRYAPQSRTAVCNLVLDGSGQLIGGIADMDITESLQGEEIADLLRTHRPSLVAFDANTTSDVMASILHYCQDSGAQAFFEPTSTIKCTRILDCFATQLKTQGQQRLDFMSPNALEAQTLYENARSRGLYSCDTWWTAMEHMSLDDRYRSELDALCRQEVHNEAQLGNEDLSFLLKDGLIQMATHLLPFVRCIFVKLGNRGALFVGHLNVEDSIAAGWQVLSSNPQRRLVVAHGKNGTTVVQHFKPEPLPASIPFNSTGAGDSFSGAILAALLRVQLNLDLGNIAEAVRLAQHCATLTLRSDNAVAPEISQTRDTPVHTSTDRL
ncbi:indigoidine synthase A-like protein [Calocera viscosa TUFC12733]|uniref:Indigoidine synthase A-like protein n=1 Tax=Calocera viscosa (strain TUFC12733) TaxID=1330018 RepID=A0A167P3P9_CALVF|nr:indigoidine synthase A-like protein [Calocera viscosa TUFC12733]